MYPSNFQKNFRLLVCAPANQQTKLPQMIFQCEYWKYNNDAGGGGAEGDAGGV